MMDMRWVHGVNADGRRCALLLLGLALAVSCGEVAVAPVADAPASAPTDIVTDDSQSDAQPASDLSGGAPDLGPQPDARADGAGAGTCMQPADCAAGEGCIAGRCGPCRSAADCRGGEGCHEGRCGPCTEPADCAPGQGCLAATGECGACRSAAECRTGEGCVKSACGRCEAGPDCAGGLCREGACEPCAGSGDDAACVEQYGDPEVRCGEDGACAPPTCTSGSDCWVADRVCSSEGRCVECEDTEACLAAGSGGYPAGTVCADGLCVEAECETSAECPEDRPICSDARFCRGCQAPDECRAREQSEGYVCELATGLCRAGDCFPVGAACGAAGDLVCGADFVCGACVNDAACRSAADIEHAICDSGRCTPGCLPPSLDAEGRLCGDDFRPRDCEGDGDCALASGYEHWVCEGGRCAEGCTPPGAVTSNGGLCGADYRATACDDDAQCAVAAGASDWICEAGTCLAGCPRPSLDPGGRVCGDDQRYRDCQGDAECAQASGYEHAVCESGRCTEGCRPIGALDPDGRICGTNHRFEGCTDDGPCAAGASNAQWICTEGLCTVGCAVPGLDPEGRVCGDDHRFRDCGEDPECAAAAGGTESYICTDGRCAVGCAPVGSLLPQGAVCGADHRPRACAEDAECSAGTGDAAWVCDDGACRAGCSVPSLDPQGHVCRDDHRFHECVGDPDCAQAAGYEYWVCEFGVCLAGCAPAGSVGAGGLVCGGDSRYRACADDAECITGTSDPASICEEGVCEMGCARHADCAGGGICGSDHRCRACVNEPGATGDDCQLNGFGSYLCVGGSCVQAECNEVSPCANGRVCVPSGSTMVCVDCVAGREDYCTNTGRVCDASTSACVDCLGNEHCSGGARLCEGRQCRDCVPGTDECGGGRVCCGGACVAGSCCADADCGQHPTQCWQYVCPQDTHLCTEVVADGGGCNDGITCTGDGICLDGGCRRGDIQEGCYIDEDCKDDGEDAAGGNACGTCDPDQNLDGWSPDASLCAAHFPGNECLRLSCATSPVAAPRCLTTVNAAACLYLNNNVCTTGVCNASTGVCQRSYAADGTSCWSADYQVGECNQGGCRDTFEALSCRDSRGNSIPCIGNVHSGQIWIRPVACGAAGTDWTSARAACQAARVRVNGGTLSGGFDMPTEAQYMSFSAPMGGTQISDCDRSRNLYADAAFQEWLSAEQTYWWIGCDAESRCGAVDFRYRQSSYVSAAGNHPYLCVR